MSSLCQFVGNKVKGRISKRVFQESKARQILQKTFFGKFVVVCFLVTLVLRFAFLSNYQRNVSSKEFILIQESTRTLSIVSFLFLCSQSWVGLTQFWSISYTEFGQKNVCGEIANDWNSVPKNFLTRLRLMF